MELATGPPRPSWRTADHAPHAPSSRSRKEGPLPPARGGHAPHPPPIQGGRRERKPPRNPARAAPPPQGALASRPEPRAPRARGERRCGTRGLSPGSALPLDCSPTSRGSGGLGQRGHAPVRWPWRPLAPRWDMRYRCAPRCMCAQVPTCVSFQSFGSDCSLCSSPASRSLGGLGRRGHAPTRRLWRPLAPRRGTRFRSYVPRCTRARVPTCVSFQSVCS